MTEVYSQNRFARSWGSNIEDLYVCREIENDFMLWRSSRQLLGHFWQSYCYKL